MVQDIFKPRTPQEVVLFSRLEPAVERLTQVLRILLSTRQEDDTLEHFLLEAFSIPNPRESSPIPPPTGEGASAPHNDLLSENDTIVQVQSDSVIVPDTSGTEEIQ